jgi:cell division protein FtsB
MSATTASSRSRLTRMADAVAISDRLALVPGRRTTASRTPFVVLMVALLVGGVVGLLAFNTQMQQRSFAASRLQSEATSLTAEQQGLRMQLEKLRDPQNLAAAAKKLHMVVPTNPAFLMLATGKIVGDPLATTTGDAMAIRPPASPKPASLNPPAKIVHVKAKAGTATTTNTTKGSTTGSPKNTGKNTAKKKTKSGKHGAASTGKTAPRGKNKAKH